jgi:hypothetical protein
MIHRVLDELGNTRFLPSPVFFCLWLIGGSLSNQGLNWWQGKRPDGSEISQMQQKTELRDSRIYIMILYLTGLDGGGLFIRRIKTSGF